MKNIKKYNFKNLLILSMFLFYLPIFLPIELEAQEQEINWIVGPGMVDLGDKLAQIYLDQNFAFANEKDAKILMERIGNPTSGQEIGLIIPTEEDPKYFILFEYSPIGYVNDDEKTNINSDAILKNIKEGTNQANKIREKRGFLPLNIIGWHEEPHYDINSNNLVWAILAESGGKQTVNYNVRLLGRSGYMSAVLVTNPATLNNDKRQIDNIISNFSYKKGKRYSEYVQGDKVAKIGLTALIAGGAATVAAKTGILNILLKNIKLVVIGVIAFFAGLWRKLKNFFSSKSNYDVTGNIE